MLSENQVTVLSGLLLIGTGLSAILGFSSLSAIWGLVCLSAGIGAVAVFTFLPEA